MKMTMLATVALTTLCVPSAGGAQAEPGERVHTTSMDMPATDTLFVEPASSDTLMVPEAMESQLMVETERSYGSVGALVGAGLGALFGQVTFTPRYGDRMTTGDVGSCLLNMFFGAACETSYGRTNSKAVHISGYALVGVAVGYLVGSNMKTSEWVAQNGAELTTAPGRNGTEIQLRFATR